MGSWLSELPDDIIYYIITNHLLGGAATTNKTAFDFSLLSKAVRSHVQSRRPTLFFEWSNDPRCLQELKYMVSTLEQNTHLETLTIKESPSLDSFLPKPVYNDYSSFDRCIQLAARSRDLVNLKLRMWRFYVLPQPVFKVESLVHLDLSGCALQPAERAIMWPNLRRLRLYHAHIGDGVLENIIRGCPFIECLNILCCSFNTTKFRFKVSNLSYLKQLDVDSFQVPTFEVNAVPNLETLTCNRHYSSACQVLDLGKHEYHKLRSLSLTYPKHLSDDLGHQCPLLEELTIEYTNPADIKRINISSLSLKKINLKSIRGLEEATFDVPNIEVLEFRCNNIPRLSVAGNSRGWISHTSFEISNADIDTSCILKLKEFLAPPSNTPKIIITFKETVTILYIYAQLQKSLLGIRSLNLSRPQPEQHQLAKEILDGILLICRPRIIWLRDEPELEFLKLLSDRLMGLTKLNDPNVQHARALYHLMEVVPGITVHHNTLNQANLSIIDKFLRRWKVEHEWDGRAIYFSIHITVQYLPPFNNFTPINNKANEKDCKSAKKSRKSSKCCCFGSPSCKP